MVMANRYNPEQHMAVTPMSGYIPSKKYKFLQFTH